MATSGNYSSKRGGLLQNKNKPGGLKSFRNLETKSTDNNSSRVENTSEQATTVPLQRARQPKQKEQRRDTILAAALDLYVRGNGQLPKVETIAREVNLAKGTAYIYFSSKEEIYLTLLEQNITAWLSNIQRELRRAQVEPIDPLDKLLRALQSWSTEQPHLWTLSALGQSVLEPAIDGKVLLAYRTRLAQQFRQTAEKIQSFLGGSATASALPVLLKTYASAIGIWQFSQTPAALSRVQQSASGGNLQLRFDESATQVWQLLWQDYLQQQGGPKKAGGLSNWFGRKR